MLDILRQPSGGTAPRNHIAEKLPRLLRAWVAPGLEPFPSIGIPRYSGPDDA
jgi:hypothetical protein